MKAKKIYESLEFKQGGDPYKTLSVGKYSDIYMKPGNVFKVLEDIIFIPSKVRSRHGYWTTNNNNETFQKGKSLSKGDEIIFKDTTDLGTLYYCFNIEFNSYPLYEFNYEDVMMFLEYTGKKLDESLDFKQGGDPYKTLSVGKYNKEFLESEGFLITKFGKIKYVFYYEDDYNNVQQFKIIELINSIDFNKIKNAVEQYGLELLSIEDIKIGLNNTGFGFNSLNVITPLIYLKFKYTDRWYNIFGKLLGTRGCYSVLKELDYASRSGYYRLDIKTSENGTGFPSYYKAGDNTARDRANSGVIVEIPLIFNKGSLYESLNFERGGDPYKKLGVGKYSDPDYEIQKQKDLDRIQQLKSAIHSVDGWHSLDNAPAHNSGTVGEWRKNIRTQINRLQNKYKTSEDKNKEYERNRKADEKRRAKQNVVRTEKKQKLKTLTPKQIAINKLIDLQRQRSDFKNMFKRPKFSYNSPPKPTDDDIRYYKEIENDIDNLKSQYNLKSTDLRRQTEYDSKYDDEINESLGFQRLPPKLSTLGVGKFRNQIDYNNLPRRGLWKVVAGTNNQDFDECIIETNAYYNDVLLIKDWDFSSAPLEDKWADSWLSVDLVQICKFDEFDKWLRSNNAFNLIQMRVTTYDIPPGWDSVENY